MKSKVNHLERSFWNGTKCVEQGRRAAAAAAGSSGDSRLRMQRKKWNDETEKRIHVAVRVRPMNINEIKADAKVREGAILMKTPVDDDDESNQNTTKS